MNGFFYDNEYVFILKKTPMCHVLLFICNLNNGTVYLTEEKKYGIY